MYAPCIECMMLVYVYLPTYTCVVETIYNNQPTDQARNSNYLRCDISSFTSCQDIE